MNLRSIIFSAVISLALVAASCTTPPDVTPDRNVPVNPAPLPSTALAPGAMPPNGPAVSPESAISDWITLAADLSDFIEKMDSNQVDDVEQEILTFQERVLQSMELTERFSEADTGSFDYSEFKSMVEQTQLALSTYIEALETQDVELEDSARDLFADVFEYAGDLLDELGQRFLIACGDISKCTE